LKNFLSVIKWMAAQARPFLFSLIIITVIGAVLSLSGVSIAVVSKQMIDNASKGNINKAVTAAVIFGVLIIITIVLRAVVSVLSARVSEKMSNSLRQRVLDEILKSQWLDSSKYHSEDILTRMTSDVSALTNGLVSLIPGMISLAVGLAAAFVTLFIFDYRLAVLAFIISPISIIFSRIFAGKMKKIYIKMQEAESTSRSFIHEALQNIVVVKAFGLEEVSQNKVQMLQQEKFNLVVRRSRMASGTSSVLSLGYWMGYFLAFSWGAFRLSSNAITFGTLAAFLQLVEQIQGPFVGLAYSLPQMISAYASSGRLIELEKMERDKTISNIPQWKSVGIKLDNVAFAYEQEKPVVQNMHSIIKPGEIIALVGPSGKGKTTIIRLLLSLTNPTEGHIYFINKEGNSIEACASTRNFISYVPQGNTLFSGTIAENLRLGRPDASDSELEEAARAACALEFIENLPEKMDTIIGERGLGLSEGQAQRIAIARALLKKAPILIFDEATSALDSHTEMMVIKAIKSQSPACTCILITHRTAALDICHRVLKLENGKLSDQYNKSIKAQASEAV
jgi:ATP-binding cassette, subfamily B, bacterial